MLVTLWGKLLSESFSLPSHGTNVCKMQTIRQTDLLDTLEHWLSYSQISSGLQTALKRCESDWGDVNVWNLKQELSYANLGICSIITVYLWGREEKTNAQILHRNLERMVIMLWMDLMPLCEMCFFFFQKTCSMLVSKRIKKMSDTLTRLTFFFYSLLILNIQSHECVWMRHRFQE